MSDRPERQPLEYAPVDEPADAGFHWLALVVATLVGSFAAWLIFHYLVFPPAHLYLDN